MRSPSRHGHTPALVDEGEPETGILGRVRWRRRLSPGTIRAHLGEHFAVVGDDGGEGDVVDAGGSSLAASWAFELQGEREGRLDEAIGEIGGGSRQVSAEALRGMLCHSVGCRASVGASMRTWQAAAGLDGDEAALEVHACSWRPRRTVSGALSRHQDLIGGLRR